MSWRGYAPFLFEVSKTAHVFCNFGSYDKIVALKTPASVFLFPLCPRILHSLLNEEHVPTSLTRHRCTGEYEVVIKRAPMCRVVHVKAHVQRVDARFCWIF